MGTAFLTCHEAGVPEAYKESILTAQGDQTRIPASFPVSKAAASCLSNELAAALGKDGAGRPNSAKYGVRRTSMFSGLPRDALAGSGANKLIPKGCVVRLHTAAAVSMIRSGVK